LKCSLYLGGASYFQPLTLSTRRISGNIGTSDIPIYDFNLATEAI
jgi:hypothetical protein